MESLMSKTQHPKKEEKQGTRRIPRPQRELQMLEAAAVEFGRKGFDATSMDDIAAACGVTKPMLYNYFGSKDGLYAAMINQAGSHLVKSIIALRELTDPVQRLHGAMGVFLEFVERYRDSWRMGFSGKGFSGKGPSGQDQQGSIADYRQQILLGSLYTVAQLRRAGTSGTAADGALCVGLAGRGRVYRPVVAGNAGHRDRAGARSYQQDD